MKSSRGLLAPLAVIVLALVLGSAVFVSVKRAAENRALATVHGIVGSEKADFFADPEVRAEFRRNEVELKIDTEGSREQATTGAKDQADFFFPAGEPAARTLAAKLGIRSTYTPFFTPMIVASWQPVAHVLMANGMVKLIAGHWYIVDMGKLMTAIAQSKRWSELAGNAEYNTNKSLLISSTDVRKSNSAAMYLALASYIYNGNNIVSSPQQAARIQTRINAIFLRQGFQEASSAGPFDDYVTIGMGKAPLVMAYEQQFIEYLMQHPPDQRPKGMIPLYPRPTVYTKHTFVPTDALGDKVGQLLLNDPTLRTLEIKHGFRNSDTAQMRAIWGANHIDVPDSLIDVIDPPSFETLESLIKGVEGAFAQQ